MVVEFVLLVPLLMVLDSELTYEILDLPEGMFEDIVTVLEFFVDVF